MAKNSFVVEVTFRNLQSLWSCINRITCSENIDACNFYNSTIEH